MTIWVKIKIVFFAFITGVVALLSFLFSREKKKRKEAEKERDTQIAINDSNKEVINKQSEITEIVLNAKKPVKKQKKKASKIILPLLFFALLLSSCTQTKYIATTTAPELYVIETGIELELIGDMYCVNEEQALMLQQALNGYKEQINTYNEWRLNNGK